MNVERERRRAMDELKQITAIRFWDLFRSSGQDLSCFSLEPRQNEHNAACICRCIAAI